MNNKAVSGIQAVSVHYNNIMYIHFVRTSELMVKCTVGQHCGY